MSSTREPAVGTATAGAVEDEQHVVTSTSPRMVVAVTRIVIGVTFVLGLRRRPL